MLSLTNSEAQDRPLDDHHVLQRLLSREAGAPRCVFMCTPDRDSVPLCQCDGATRHLVMQIEPAQLGPMSAEYTL